MAKTVEQQQVQAPSNAPSDIAVVAYIAVLAVLLVVWHYTRQQIRRFNQTLER